LSLKFTYKIVFALALLVLTFSCRYFVKPCPLPTCEIAKSHRHLLIFSEAPKEKKGLFSFLKKKKKDKNDSTSTQVDSLGNEFVDSTASDATEEEFHDEHKHKKNESEHDASFVEVDGTVLDEEGNVYVDPKEQKKKDKLAKKEEKKLKKQKKKEAKQVLKNKGNVDTTSTQKNIDEDDEDDEYEGMTEEEYKKHRLNPVAKDTTHMHQYNEKELAKQLKKEDKIAQKKAKKEDKEARKGKKGQADYTRLYRSRVTKWWRKDQNPKIGKYFKRQTDSVSMSKKKSFRDIFTRKTDSKSKE
jgi:hypothetical protein